MRQSPQLGPPPTVGKWPANSSSGIGTWMQANRQARSQKNSPQDGRCDPSTFHWALAHTNKQHTQQKQTTDNSTALYTKGPQEKTLKKAKQGTSKQGKQQLAPKRKNRRHKKIKAGKSPKIAARKDSGKVKQEKASKAKAKSQKTQRET